MPLSKRRDRERKRQVGLEKREIQPNIPLYNPSTHRIGDKVRVGEREIVIPEIDADGNTIPDSLE